MARTPGQRGSFGRWLTDARTKRYRTQKLALQAMEKIAGLKISESEYAQWESGSRTPREDNPKVARLYEFFGSRPEDEEDPTPTDLVTALAAQTDAITALVGELLRWRTEDRDRIAELEAWMDRTIEQTPGAPGTAGAAARRALRESAE